MERPHIKIENTMKYKKSQLTIFLILGVVLISIVIFLLYLLNQSAKAKIETGIETTTKSSLNAQPIFNYVTDCLDKTSLEAIDLVGKQGGYIYNISQGGTLPDFHQTQEGSFFIKYDNHNVPYLILPVSATSGDNKASIPEYPWQTFPYKGTNTANFTGQFGKSKLPPLTENEGDHSIQAQIKTYVEKNLKSCINFSVFGGYEISLEEVNASVLVARNDIFIEIDFPVEIRHTQTGEKTKKSKFSTRRAIRMEKIHSFANSLIDNDIHDISFNIDGNSNDVDGLEVSVTRNVLVKGNTSKDDLITITDTNSLLNGKPYKFRFARQNRHPALFFFNTSPDPLPAISSNANVSPLKVVDENGVVVVPGIKIIPIHPITPLNASDPDEDALTINYICENNAPLKTCNPAVDANTCNNFNCKVNKNWITFRINVTDGELTDYRGIAICRVGTLEC